MRGLVVVPVCPSIWRISAALENAICRTVQPDGGTPVDLRHVVADCLCWHASSSLACVARSQLWEPSDLCGSHKSQCSIWSRDSELRHIRLRQSISVCIACGCDSSHAL